MLWCYTYSRVLTKSQDLWLLMCFSWCWGSFVCTICSAAGKVCCTASLTAKHQRPVQSESYEKSTPLPWPLLLTALSWWDPGSFHFPFTHRTPTYLSTPPAVRDVLHRGCWLQRGSEPRCCPGSTCRISASLSLSPQRVFRCCGLK